MLELTIIAAHAYEGRMLTFRGVADFTYLWYTVGTGIRANHDLKCS